MIRRRPPSPAPAVAVAPAHAVLDAVVVALARRASAALSRRPGFVPADRDDIEQALFAAVHRSRRRFRPARGSWRAFAATVIARRAASLARDRRAPSRAGPGHAPLEDVTRDRRRPRPSADPADAVPLAIDVARVLAAGPPVLRAVAERVMGGETLTRAAKALGVARTTARDQLRRRFEDLRLWAEG
jgi:DNA-directed RNA polymerase specialized sigma24 family protein